MPTQVILTASEVKVKSILVDRLNYVLDYVHIDAVLAVRTFESHWCCVRSAPTLTKTATARSLEYLENSPATAAIEIDENLFYFRY